MISIPTQDLKMIKAYLQHDYAPTIPMPSLSKLRIQQSSRGIEMSSPISSRIWSEVCSQIKISTPTTISLLLYKLPWLISLHFVGQLGPDELSAAALATTICNVTGMSICLGMSSAIATLTGQTIGRILQDSSKNHPLQMDGVHTALKTFLIPIEAAFSKTEINGEKFARVATQMKPQINESHRTDGLSPIITLLFRGILLPFVIIIPVGIWWIYGIKATLIILGQEERVSMMAEAYLRVLVPGLWFYSIQWTLSAWMQAVNMADIPAYAAFCGLLLHVPFNIIFVRVLGLGYRGVALATVLFQIIQPLLMVSYLLTIHGRRRLSCYSLRPKTNRRHELREAMDWKGIVQYLQLAGPGIVLITEWWASEAIIFLGGRLKTNPQFALGAMSLYQSINTFCVMFPMGLSTSCSTRVGTLLGRSDNEGAKFAYRVSMVEAVATCTLISCCLAIVPNSFFPALFTQNIDVIDEASKTIPFLTVYVIADGLQVTLNGAIRGCGRQYLAMPIVIFSYWMVGIPLSYIAAFRHNLGTVGLVFGITIGKWIHILLLWFIFTLIIDWKKEAEYAQERSQISKELSECSRLVYGSITLPNHDNLA